MMEQLIVRLVEENCPYLPSGGSVDQHLKWIKGQMKWIGFLVQHASIIPARFYGMRNLLNPDFIESGFYPCF
jgi:hypothetical protein